MAISILVAYIYAYSCRYDQVEAREPLYTNDSPDALSSVRFPDALMRSAMRISDDEEYMRTPDDVYRASFTRSLGIMPLSHQLVASDMEAFELSRDARRCKAREIFAADF